MREDFLHYIWQFKKFDISELLTASSEVVEILNSGSLNLNAGPDFFNAKLKIGEQVWAGNVEIHIKSSDWYRHNHETDKAYDSIILHVVWEHDVDVFRKDNTAIPTLELKNYINEEALIAYQKLFSKTEKWINCEADIKFTDQFLIDNWLEKLYIERLENKSVLINELLNASNNDWEEVFFKLLSKNFGLKVNGEAFFQWANQTPFHIVRKQQQSLEHLEALFFGQANLLDSAYQDHYPKQLQQNYIFLKQKYNLNSTTAQIQFFRLRPNNFPTVRLSQFAGLYYKYSGLFAKLMAVDRLDEIYDIFNIEASPYWKTHFSFDKSSAASAKRLTKEFIDLIIVNTIIPVRFAYLKSQDVENFEPLLLFLKELKPEKNKILSGFSTLGVKAKSALESQSLLQLKNNYCDKNKCLQCAIGNNILLQK